MPQKEQFVFQVSHDPRVPSQSLDTIRGHYHLPPYYYVVLKSVSQGRLSHGSDNQWERLLS